MMLSWRTNSVGTRKRGLKFVLTSDPYPGTKEGLEKRMSSISFSDAFITAAWLNATKGTRAQKRVVDIWRQLDDLGAKLRSLIQRRQSARVAGIGRREPITEQEMEEIKDRAELHEQFRKDHNALNRLLNRYSLVPVLAYDLNAGIWRYNSVPRTVRGPTIQVSTGFGMLQVDETTVVAALLRLATSRKLDKVRLCERCREVWRVSERKIDRFCGKTCRVAYFTHNPEYRQRKAEARRRHRQQPHTKRPR